MQLRNYFKEVTILLKSTRSDEMIEPSKAILKGLSSDGGLFVFDKLNKNFFDKRFLEMNYQALCFEVFSEFLTDYPAEAINWIIKKSYNPDKFKGGIVGVVPFDQHAYLNLFHGNTFAFKDLALSCLPNLMTKAKQINHITKKTIILTATSGDTGSATLEGFNESKDVTVIVLYPTAGVSKFQELQMHQYASDKNYIIPIKGNFDDCQRIVKNSFLSLHPTNVILSSANSINIGRIIPQTVYYFYAYLELVRQGQIAFNETINVTVPTGNFGNIYAAYIAKSMGLPIKNLIVATNQNKVLSEVFSEGIYNINRELYQTISPSMDILVSSNFERYLFDVLKHDSRTVHTFMDQLKTKKEMNLKPYMNKASIKAYDASEKETLNTIKTVFDTDHYVIDPHTAVAKCVADKYLAITNDPTYMLVVSTANPYKFSDALLTALNKEITSDLETNLNLLEAYTKTSIDPRMKNILHQKVEKTAVTISKASQQIKQIVGDLDVKN